MEEGIKRVEVPGMSDLLKSIKELEDHARTCQSGDDLRMVALTREEEEVIESFRRFKAQDYE
jgi:hypothetical protein